jgi:hypothetical protein
MTSRSMMNDDKERWFGCRELRDEIVYGSQKRLMNWNLTAALTPEWLTGGSRGVSIENSNCETK